MLSVQIQSLLSYENKGLFTLGLVCILCSVTEQRRNAIFLDCGVTQLSPWLEQVDRRGLRKGAMLIEDLTREKWTLPERRGGGAPIPQLMILHIMLISSSIMLKRNVINHVNLLTARRHAGAAAS